MTTEEIIRATIAAYDIKSVGNTEDILKMMVGHILQEIAGGITDSALHLCGIRSFNEEEATAK